MKIIRNAQGECINIGPWDFMVDQAPDGTSVALNPMPEGAYEDEADVVTGKDGGLYLADDPRRMGPAASLPLKPA